MLSWRPKRGRRRGTCTRLDLPLFGVMKKSASLCYRDPLLIVTWTRAPCFPALLQNRHPQQHRPHLLALATTVPATSAAQTPNIKRFVIFIYLCLSLFCCEPHEKSASRSLLLRFGRSFSCSVAYRHKHYITCGNHDRYSSTATV